MLSQLKHAVAAALVLCFIFAARSHAGELVKGTGIHRDAAACLRNLPLLGSRLQSSGLRLTRPLDCEEVQGEPDSFVPIFEAEADAPILAETAMGSYVHSRTECEQNLKALLTFVAEHNERVIESGCVPVSIADGESGELQTGQFQPMILLLKINR